LGRVGGGGGRAFWAAVHSEIHLWQEGVVHHAISFGDFVFVVAQKRHGDLLLLRPRLLRERIVAADPVNGSVQVAVSVQPSTNFTHLRRARARERHGKKKQQIGRAHV